MLPAGVLCNSCNSKLGRVLMNLLNIKLEILHSKNRNTTVNILVNVRAYLSKRALYDAAVAE
jgi:hypothetical protein